MRSMISVSNTARRGAALAMACVMAACGGAKEGATPADSGAATAGGAGGAGGKTFTIAMIAKSSTNPVFLSGRQGAEAAAAELTKEHGVTVKIDWPLFAFSEYM